jgi:hypothetical protein
MAGNVSKTREYKSVFMKERDWIINMTIWNRDSEN